MIVNDEFSKKIIEKYIDMKSRNFTEDYLDINILGKIKIYINAKPKHIFLSLEVENDQIYLGSNN